LNDGAGVERMTPPTRFAVLETLVDCYEEHGKPLAPGALAATLDADPGTVEEHLVALEECALVAGGEGYRPTVTGREFLDAVGEGFAVVDPDGSE
jgi:predicted transcriptional regulator